MWRTGSKGRVEISYYSKIISGGKIGEELVQCGAPFSSSIDTSCGTRKRRLVGSYDIKWPGREMQSDVYEAAGYDFPPCNGL